jgi:hypothetical protein
MELYLWLYIYIYIYEFLCLLILPYYPELVINYLFYLYKPLQKIWKPFLITSLDNTDKYFLDNLITFFIYL